MQMVWLLDFICKPFPADTAIMNFPRRYPWKLLVKTQKSSSVRLDIKAPFAWEHFQVFYCKVALSDGNDEFTWKPSRWKRCSSHYQATSRRCGCRSCNHSAHVPVSRFQKVAFLPVYMETETGALWKCSTVEPGLKKYCFLIVHV